MQYSIGLFNKKINNSFKNYKLFIKEQFVKPSIESQISHKTLPKGQKLNVSEVEENGITF
jgi:hypothetical protein